MAERAAWTETVVDDSRPLWLEGARDELDALARPRSVALAGGEAVDRVAGSAVLAELGRVFGAAPVSVTEVGLAGEPARGWQELLERLEGHRLLYDLEALCWDPWLGLDLRRFLEMGVIDLT